MSDIAKVLLDQGNLVALLLLVACVHLYRENRRLIDRYETKSDNILSTNERTLASVRDLLAYYVRRRPPQ